MDAKFGKLTCFFIFPKSFVIYAFGHSCLNLSFIQRPYFPNMVCCIFYCRMYDNTVSRYSYLTQIYLLHRLSKILEELFAVTLSFQDAISPNFWLGIRYSWSGIRYRPVPCRRHNSLCFGWNTWYKPRQELGTYLHLCFVPFFTEAISAVHFLHDISRN